jgi:hypothetical protein
MTFELGQWKCQCDRCGFWFKARQLRKEWNGLRVCGDCWEPRHPQDFVKGKADRQAPVWVRPDSDGPDVSVGSGNEVTEGDL